MSRKRQISLDSDQILSDIMKWSRQCGLEGRVLSIYRYAQNGFSSVGNNTLVSLFFLATRSFAWTWKISDEAEDRYIKNAAGTRFVRRLVFVLKQCNGFSWEDLLSYWNSATGFSSVGRNCHWTTIKMRIALAYSIIWVEVWSGLYKLGTKSFSL